MPPPWTATTTRFPRGVLTTLSSEFEVNWCSDDIVVGGVCPGVKQLRHRRHEPIISRIFQGPSQRVGDVRFEDDLRFHFDIVHLDIVLLFHAMFVQAAKGRYRKVVATFRGATAT